MDSPLNDPFEVRKVPGLNPSTVARIDYDPETGQWHLWEYGLEQQSGFDSIEALAAYLRDYPTQLLQKL